MFNRRRLAVALSAALFAACPLAMAQPVIHKTLKIVVGFPPGGAADSVARLLAEQLQGSYAPVVIIDNRPGAGGNIGGQAAARAAGDGYTLFMGTVGTHAINEALYKKMPFDPVKDFAPLTRVANVPNLLVAHPSQPFKTVKEMMAYAKANPGKLAFGSGSNGSAGHLAGELFKVETGTDAVHVPFKGGAPATQALLAGDTQFMFDNLANAMAQVKAGKIKALAVTTAQRSSLVPDLPTMAEAGLPGFDISTWYGLFAPAGTPPSIVAKWNADVTKILTSPDVRAKLVADGADPSPDTPEQFKEFIAKELAKYARIVKASGAKVD